MAPDAALHPRLASLTGPQDLRDLDAAALDELAAEIRVFLVESVCRTGGHLGPNLGVVELTLALHRVFSSPRDVLLWDTGHQAYVHKLLTGRLDGFPRLRRAGGLSGYPNRAESVHDHVENSHASTALAYADGLAKAFAVTGAENRAVVAVIGDGALTGGMAWEALNNLAGSGRPVVVVLNDNGRSYDPTVGGLADHLRRLRDTGEPSLFESLGMHYLGPVDGHDVAAVEAALRAAADAAAPVVVHCVTTKGRGYLPAETDEADRLHAVPARVAGPARTDAALPTSPPWTDVLGAELARIGDERPDVVAVTAAMLRPVGLYPFALRHPDRVFDVGIAEQQAVTSAAGLAMGGLHPVVCVYSTFLTRAVDQVLMDVALHGLPVTFVLDRAGVTGEDGPSHHGMWDLALLSVVPNLRVAAPRDAGTLRSLLREAVAYGDGPTALRFPKGACAPELPVVGRVGSADVLVVGPCSDVLLVPVGPMAGPACAAADELRGAGLGVTVVDPRWVFPVDPALRALAAQHRLVVTVEDGVASGGFGDALAAALRVDGGTPELLTLGLPSQFLAHGSRNALLAEAGLDVAGIVGRVLSACDAVPLRAGMPAVVSL